MFQPLSGLKSSEGYEKTTSLNSTHLENLLVKLEDYFPFLSIEEYDWLPVDNAIVDAQIIIINQNPVYVKLLQFSVNVAPLTFQRAIDKAAIGIPGLYPYLRIFF
ncbi:hypothetical protein T09_10449 [Trichinella sp. T9]|nr:hypothetical protein T09_9536 [Trichinella sp. T9]KRX52518.1 hypothetical protein T09_10449 [Trichinella sp. T9]